MTLPDETSVPPPDAAPDGVSGCESLIPTPAVAPNPKRPEVIEGTLLDFQLSDGNLTLSLSKISRLILPPTDSLPEALTDQLGSAK
jgi:hypothetical protein